VKIKNQSLILRHFDFGSFWGFFCLFYQIIKTALRPLNEKEDISFSRQSRPKALCPAYGVFWGLKPLYIVVLT